MIGPGQQVMPGDDGIPDADDVLAAAGFVPEDTERPADASTWDVEEWLAQMNYHEQGRRVLKAAAKIVRESRRGPDEDEEADGQHHD